MELFPDGLKACFRFWFQFLTAHIFVFGLLFANLLTCLLRYLSSFLFIILFLFKNVSVFLLFVLLFQIYGDEILTRR